MPARPKKANKNKPSGCLPQDKQTEDEKENISSEKPLKIDQTDGSSSKLQPAKNKSDEGNQFLSTPKQTVKVKAAGFWSKKLQDLELVEDETKKGKCSLYEFDGTEELESYKKKKKKAGVTKRKKTTVSKANKLALNLLKHDKRANKVSQSEKKIKQIHRKSLFREQIMLSKEREKLADKGKKFTFSTGMQSLGITSTPALNKDNLIGASNFLFLSPIINKEAECCSGNDEHTPLKSTKEVGPNFVCSEKKNPKGVETELKRHSCRRVLRSGKMLIT